MIFYGHWPVLGEEISEKKYSHAQCFEADTSYTVPCYHEANIRGEGKIVHVVLKGTVSRDFLLLVFFMNQFPPSP